MAKASSPIRLQQALMQQAELTAKRFHRSTAEQVEYWAELGRTVASTLDPDVVLSIQAGLSRLLVEPVIANPVEPEAIFASLEEQRENGSLQQNISHSPVRYQASLSQPGWLERVDQQGEVTIGRFQNGQFIAQSESGS